MLTPDSKFSIAWTFIKQWVLNALEVEIKPTEKIVVLGLDERSLEHMAWCAATFGINRLFWSDGYLLCTEVFEESFKHEIEKGEFCISQVCYTRQPRFSRVHEVEKGTQIPVVDVSEMRVYRSLVKAIKEHEAEKDS